jgi:hypothetical protein
MSLADAIIAQDKDLVQKLLQLGDENINVVDEYGYLPLIQCAIMDDLALARILLDAGANCNLQATTGTTALYWAVENNNRDLVKLLLAHGADPNLYTTGGEAPLVIAMLRRYLDIKNMLIDAGGDLEFVYDFINTKLLAHRYELSGAVDIVDSKERFTEIQYEGFILEFSLLAVRNAVYDFIKHYMFRDHDKYKKYFRIVLQALSVSAELIRYQQYRTDLPKSQEAIVALLRKKDLLIIPIAHAGHASALVVLGDHMVVVDRRQDSYVIGSIGIYKIGNLTNWNEQFIFYLLYTKKPLDFMTINLYQILDLQLMGKILMPAQITGNCSWANIEAAIPAALFLLYKRDGIEFGNVVSYHDLPLAQFLAWQEWDLDRELKFCFDSFWRAKGTIRRAAKASLLAAILFQRLSVSSEKDVAIAKKILKILQQKNFRYILDSYIEVYLNLRRTKAGENLKAIMQRVEEEEF